jgi:transposase
MKKNLFFIGLDISKADFAASIYQVPDQPIVTKEAIPNDRKGFEMLLLWLNDYHIDKKNCRICMEATGVYSQAIAYYLLFAGFPVSVEPPLKVKRAFDPIGHKTDPVDSKQIAEYAYRFQDELTSWKPRDEILEKIRQLLSVREQFTKQKVALDNSIQAYNKQRVQVALIKKAQKETLNQLKKQIARIDKELEKLIKQDPEIFQKASNLKSIPGYGMLLAAHLLVITENFTKIQNSKRLASFVGIVPYQHQSGTSVYKKAKIRHFGPGPSRKLLRLAAQSVATHNATFRRYYLRKLDQGKPKPLVLNNIANKLLKIACTVIRNNTRYIKDYRSINPMYLKSLKSA